MELRCLAPEGIPPPDVTWLRNGQAVEPKKEGSNLIISSEGHLLVVQARLADMGNYTCVSENVAGKRVSDTAILTVFGKCIECLFCFARSLFCLFTPKQHSTDFRVSSQPLLGLNRIYRLPARPGNRLPVWKRNGVKLSSKPIHHATQFSARHLLDSCFMEFFLPFLLHSHCELYKRLRLLL